MEKPKYHLMRTLRLKNDNVPGVLGKVATAIGGAGGNIGNIRTVSLGHKHVVRDLDIFVDDEEHLNGILLSIAKLRGVALLEVRDEVLELHQGGKIKMVSTVQVDSVAVLRKVYTPGVADVCRRLQKDPSLKYSY